MRDSQIFDSRKVKKLLGSLYKLSKEPEVNLPPSMKSIVKLHHKNDEKEIMDYHLTEDYSTYLVENDSRLNKITILMVDLWEPFAKVTKERIEYGDLHECRILRNRYSHSLLESPPNPRVYLTELKAALWTNLEWAAFVAKSLELMAEYVEITPLLTFKDGDDILNAASQASHKLEHHRTDLKNVIDFLSSEDEWNRYIDVRDQKGNVAIERLTSLLDLDKPRIVVQICGEGGLGKTALVREYIRRNIMNAQQEDLFENYLILSGKSDIQGEVKTIPSGTNKFETMDPKYPKKGPVRYTEGLNFKEFLRIIAAYAKEESTDVDTIRRAIEQHNFLIVLDNFEDCSDGDRKLYLDLFESIKSGCKSRIIITGRKEASADDIPTIRLGYLSSGAASELLIARYLYLQQMHASEGIWEFRNAIYNALHDLKEIDFIEKMNLSLANGAVDVSEQLNPAVFRDRIGHPLVILRMAVEMGRPSLPATLLEDHPDATRRLIAVLAHIAASDGFKSWEENVSQWVTEKAYDDIRNHNECVIVLHRLVKGIASMTELKDYVQSEGGEVDKVSEAIRRLESHQILIRRRSSDDRYEATEQTKDHISLPSDESAKQTDVGTKIADEIESILADILDITLGEKENEGRDDPLANLLSQEIPLHKRQVLTKRSYKLIELILLNLSGNLSPLETKMTEAFAKLGAQVLEKEEGELRQSGTNILLRSLYALSVDASEIHAHTRNLTSHDISVTNTETRMLFMHHLLRSIQNASDLYPIYMAEFLSILAACGAHSAALISELKGAWSRILSHPNIKHGNLDGSVEGDARLLLRRMAQNDESWSKATAVLLNRYQAEDERQHWDDVRDWPRYSLPPFAPEIEVYTNLLIPESFKPGINGLSFDVMTADVAEFCLIESPVLSPRGTAQEHIVNEVWPSEKQEAFTQSMITWLQEKITERPAGFAGTDLTNYIQKEFGRTKTILTQATGGRFTSWVPWFEDTILSLPQFQAYFLERRPHVVISRRDLTFNPLLWLFDNTSTNAPKLPRLSDMSEIIRSMSRDHELGWSLQLRNVDFLTSYQEWVKKSRFKGGFGSTSEHFDCIRDFVVDCMEKSEISSGNRKQIITHLEEWWGKVTPLIETFSSVQANDGRIARKRPRKKRNQLIKPIRRRRKLNEEE